MTMLLIGTAMILAATVYAILTVFEVTFAEAKPLPMPRRKPATESPGENPYPIGSDEFWTWQPK